MDERNKLTEEGYTFVTVEEILLDCKREEKQKRELTKYTGGVK